MTLHSGEPLGDCGLWRRVIEDEWEVEIGYHFARRHWGNGYATEAASSMPRVRGERGIDRVVALILPENDALDPRGGANRHDPQPHGAARSRRPHVLWETAPRVTV